MEQTKVAVYIADAEAQKFLLFNQHYDTFDILLNNGVFDIKSGNALLHFDHLGVLQNITRTDTLYSRRHS